MKVYLQPSTGNGTIITFTHVMAPFYPDGSPFELPYTVVLVRLHEEVNVLSKMKVYTPMTQQGIQVHIDLQNG